MVIIMTSPARFNSLPTIRQPQPPVEPLATPVKQNSSPAVVATKSVAVINFEKLLNRFFKECGDNYGNGKVGQTAIDDMWEILRTYAEQHPECKNRLPQKPINERVSDEALAFIQSIRAGW